MSEVNLDRMEKLIGMGFEKEKAYEMVKAEAEADENNSKTSEENDKIKRLEQELEETKKALGEKDKDKDDKDDKPATKDDKQIDPKDLKKKNEDEPEYIQVLKKFC